MPSDRLAAHRDKRDAVDARTRRWVGAAIRGLRHWIDQDLMPSLLQECEEPSPEAEARAKELLVRLLNPTQRASFQRCGRFLVEVPGRGRFFIFPRRIFNVVHLETGRTFCCVCSDEIPLSDLMLAQKLFLENDAERFFATAHWRPPGGRGSLRRGPPPDPENQVRKSRSGCLKCFSRADRLE